MSRLTQGDRVAIENALVERAFKDAAASMKKRKEAAALSCFRELVPEDVQTRLDALPDGWVPMVTAVGINVPTIYETWYLDTPRRCPDSLVHYGCVSFEKTKGDLVDAVCALCKEDSALDREERETRNKVRGVLRGISTWKRLLEVWPEAADVIKPLMPTGTGKAIARIPQELNAALRLP